MYARRNADTLPYPRTLRTIATDSGASAGAVIVGFVSLPIVVAEEAPVVERWSTR